MRRAMKIEPYEFGAGKNQLVVIDAFFTKAQRAAALTARIVPFAPEETTVILACVSLRLNPPTAWT